METDCIGARTTISAFTHILAGARIGADCKICHHVFVEDGVTIGDRVTIRSGVQLWNGIVLEDDVFVGPNATFTNETFPRTKQQAPESATVVRRGAFIGANATILPGLVIGESAMVGAGAVVTHNVPPNAVVVGNPARIRGYVNAPMYTREAVTPSGDVGVYPTTVRDVTVHQLPRAKDLRGSLMFAEARQHLPFDIHRVFVTYGVPSKEVRGEHAHRTLHQLLICVHGSCHVIADDGSNREEFRLDSPTTGIYVPPMVWATEYKHSPDAVLMVLASAPYDPADYIRNYDEFRRLCGRP